MAHDKAKQLLAEADNFEARQHAIVEAIQLGMPLNEIEQYLDWLDNSSNPNVSTRQKPPGMRLDREAEKPRQRGKWSKWKRVFLADSR